jgi:hypothetical protein
VRRRRVEKLLINLIKVLRECADFVGMKKNLVMFVVEKLSNTDITVLLAYYLKSETRQ